MPTKRRQPAASGEEHEQEQRAEHESPEDDDGGLEHVDAELDEEKRRAPDRGEKQQKEGVAAAHGPSRVEGRKGTVRQDLRRGASRYASSTVALPG